MSIRAIFDVIDASARVPHTIARLIAEYARNDDAWFVAEVLGRVDPLEHDFVQSGHQCMIYINVFTYDENVKHVDPVPWIRQTDRMLSLSVLDKATRIISHFWIMASELVVRMKVHQCRKRQRIATPSNTFDSAISHLRNKLADAIEGV